MSKLAFELFYGVLKFSLLETIMALTQIPDQQSVIHRNTVAPPILWLQKTENFWKITENLMRF